MNIAVSFSLRFAEDMLICHKGVFKTRRPLFTENHSLYHFSRIFSAS